MMKKISFRKFRLKKINFSFMAYPVYYFYCLLTATLRYTEEGREHFEVLKNNGEKLVFCLWHDELFPLMKVKRDLDLVTVVSPSKDGGLLARVLELLGLRTVRGSSTRQGMNALLNAVKMMKQENDMHGCVVTIDGPLGPRHEVKDGSLFLAYHANAYIVPLRIVIANAYTFNSWDKFQLPLPFSKVRIIFEKPYKINSEKFTTEVLQEEKAKLQNILDNISTKKGDING